MRSAAKVATALLVCGVFSATMAIVTFFGSTSRAAMPPSIRTFTAASPDTSTWPGYIRHHARADSLAREIDDMKRKLGMRP